MVSRVEEVLTMTSDWNEDDDIVFVNDNQNNIINPYQTYGDGFTPTTAIVVGEVVG